MTDDYGTRLQAQVSMLYDICPGDDNLVKFLLKLKILPEEAAALKKLIARAKSKKLNVEELILQFQWRLNEKSNT